MKLGVCVPYRNREKHLAEFSPKVHKFLNERGIQHKIYFAHQCDNLLFNRGKMKNIAADIAFKDGCDYIVWHDIDMIPEDDSCDYSFPKKNPTHIAVKISQSDYKLKYEQYFGGAVLFTKEQAYKVNGYSNDYWDWGMEDDDLFWRCSINDMVNKKYIVKNKVKNVAVFKGDNSFMEIKPYDKLNQLTSSSHTISILVKAQQKENLIPIYLIGDNKKNFYEYPILRRVGYDWGISFNNSRAYSSMIWNDNNNLFYSWGKRIEDLWTWVTFSVDSKLKKIHFYINGKEIDESIGMGQDSPIFYLGKLKQYDSSFYIGASPSIAIDSPEQFFAGEIAEIKMYNKYMNKNQIKKSITNDFSEGLILHYDFKNVDIPNNTVKDETKNNFDGKFRNVSFKKTNIDVYDNPIPYRKDGKFFCLPHKDEGLINGEWAKGDTTARNERRYILEMQKGNYDWKNDGLNNLKYQLLSIEELGNNSVMINCKC